MKIELTNEERAMLLESIDAHVFDITEELKYMAGDEEYSRDANACLDALLLLSRKLSNHSFDENSCKTEQNLV